MSYLSVAVLFTESSGVPATGLTLAEINMYLTAQHRTTGVDTVIWDGTQHPTSEIDNIGAYLRIYNAADFTTYNYYARGSYTGATVLDTDHVTGYSQAVDQCLGDGSVETTLNVIDSGGNPVDGACVWITTDVAGHNKIASDYSDAFGHVTVYLDPGTYYAWQSLSGYTFTNPVVFVVV